MMMTTTVVISMMMVRRRCCPTAAVVVVVGRPTEIVTHVVLERDTMWLELARLHAEIVTSLLLFIILRIAGIVISIVNDFTVFTFV